MAHTSTGRRAGLVLALAALLAPLGIGTAQAAETPPVVVTPQPSGIVGRQAPIEFACSDPDTIGLEFRTSDSVTPVGSAAVDRVSDGLTYVTAMPVYNSIGSHWIEASCVGSDGNSPYSMAFGVEIAGQPTTTSLQVFGPEVPGDPAYFTVHVESENAVPNGQVELWIDGQYRHVLTLNNGFADLQDWGPFTGPQVQVEARYLGTGDVFAPSTSGTKSFDVLPTSVPPTQPTVTLQAPATAYANSTFSVSATVAGAENGPTPTGTVSFRYSEGATLASNIPLVNGVATANVAVSHTGTADIYAVYSGDEHYTDRTSARSYVLLSEVPVPVVTVQAAKTGTTAAGITATVTVTAPQSDLPVPGGGVQLIVYRPGNYPDSVTSGVLVNGSVTLTTDTLPVGEYRLLAHFSGGGNYPYAQTDSPEQSLVISAPTTPTTPKPPVTQPVPAPPIPNVPPSMALPGTTPTPLVTLDRAVNPPGGLVTLRATGFVPGERVRFVLHSDPVFLGTAIADADGVATLIVELPEGTPVGQHHVVATGVDSGRVAEVPLLVSDPRATLATTGVESTTALSGMVATLLATGAGLLLVARLRRRQA